MTGKSGISLLGLQTYTTIHTQSRLSYIQVHGCILYRLFMHRCACVYVCDLRGWIDHGNRVTMKNNSDRKKDKTGNKKNKKLHLLTRARNKNKNTPTLLSCHSRWLYNHH